LEIAHAGSQALCELFLRARFGTALLSDLRVMRHAYDLKHFSAN
jgi:hypothetical protein